MGIPVDYCFGIFARSITSAQRAMLLSKLLGSMKDDSGRVTVAGFYDDVTPLSPAERAAIAADRAAIEKELVAAREVRETAAARVPHSTLHKYDRIRHRKGTSAVFPLIGPSCGNCDTAIPLQRRNAMAGTGNVELCEVCGVLLYAAEG